MEALRLFETTDLLEQYVYNCFKLYSNIDDEKKLRSIFSKAFELGYIGYETREFKHLTLNKSKKIEFFNYLFELEQEVDPSKTDNLLMPGLLPNKDDSNINSKYDNHEVLIEEVSTEIEMFQTSFLSMVIKLKDRLDKASYYDLYIKRNILIDPYFANIQLYADSLQELLRLFHSKLILYVLRSVMFWPRRIRNKQVLNKLNSVVFAGIIEMCNLLDRALKFEDGQEFNGYLDKQVLGKIDISLDLLDYAKNMSDPIIEKESQSLLNSITHVYTECQKLSYPEPPDLP